MNRERTVSSAELERLLQAQYELEKNVAKMLSRTVEDTKNSILRLYLNRLVLDSLKHADMIQALMDLRKGTVLSIPHRELMEENLKGHIAREEEMLRRLDEIISQVHEPKTKSLLQHIADDEKRHHKILNEVSQILTWRDSTQEDWWNTVDRIEWTF